MYREMFIEGVKVVFLQAPEGKELDYFPYHMNKIEELTQGGVISNMESVSGFNARSGRMEELFRDIEKTILKYRQAYEGAKTRVAEPGKGGSVKYDPCLVIVQNYGWGIYGQNGIVEDFEKWARDWDAKRNAEKQV
jgi:hypothetical protein